MEHVLYKVHIRILNASNRFLNSRVRRGLEVFVLIIAVCSLALLCSLHTSYVVNSSNRRSNCMSTHLGGQLTVSENPYDVIEFRISNYGLRPENNVKSYLFSYERGLLMLNDKIRDRNNFSRHSVEMDAQGSCFGPWYQSFILRRWTSHDIVIMNWAVSTFGGNGYLYKSDTRELFNLNFAGDFESKKGISLQDKGKTADFLLTDGLLSRIYIFLFGEPPQQWETVTISSQYQCFGLEKMYCEANECVSGSQSSLGNLSGCGSLILDNTYRFVGFRTGVVLSILFLFVVTTTLVSYTLRETQDRMLKFTYLLQYHVAHRLPIVALVSTHVLESLIFVPIMMGIYFFLFEFFSDQLLAFLVILVVWMGEIFSVLSCRCRTSIKYFPKIFCCYFCLFHLYFFTYPFGFSYLALFTCTAFILHAMMYFWNVFEVKAVELGQVHASQLRFGFVVPNDSLSLGEGQSREEEEDQQAEERRVAPSADGRPRSGSGSLSSSSGSSKATASPQRSIEVRSLPSIYETPAARAIRLQAKDEATRGHDSMSSSAAVSSREPAAAAHSASLRYRSNSEGSAPARPAAVPVAGSSGKSDKYGYSSAKFTVFGNFEDEA